MISKTIKQWGKQLPAGKEIQRLHHIHTPQNLHDLFSFVPILYSYVVREHIGIPVKKRIYYVHMNTASIACLERTNYIYFFYIRATEQLRG